MGDPETETAAERNDVTMANAKTGPNRRRMRRKRAKTPTILQMEATECGAASLGMILGYYGQHVPLDALRDECGVSRDGSNALRIQQTAKRHGLAGSGRRCSPEDARGLEPPFLAFWQRRHFLVVEGFGRDRVYLNDPASGRRIVSADEFARDFSQVALVYRPGPEFQRGGRRSAPWQALTARLKASRTLWGLIVLAGLAITLPSLLAVVFGKIFIDEILIGEKTDWLRPLLIAMALTMALRVGLLAIQLALMARLELGMASRDASRFFRHVLRLPLRFFHLRYAGDVASRVGSNFRVARAFAGELGFAAVGVILAVCYGAMTFAFDPWVAAAGVGLGSLNLAALRLASRRRSEEKRKIERVQSHLSSSLAWSIQSIESIKASASEADAMMRFTGLQARLINAKQRLGRASAALAAVPPLTGYLTGAAILSLGGWRVIAGALTIGSLNALQALFNQFREPLDNLVRLGSSIQELEADVNRLDDVNKHRADPIYDVDDDRGRWRPSGRVEARGLRFGYDPFGPPLIEDFSLTLAPGRRVALVGASGSGKSTVGRLIAGLLAPWEGEILFDGIPIRNLDRESITDGLALVNDQPFLCYGTVRENLTLWDDTVLDADLLQAMADAAILDDIQRRPGGLSSRLIEDARNLSGGQRQRLEIARALARSPRILILDEAASALDPPTEQRVDQAIRARGCSCLIIAHRLSTIRDADEIIVLDRGRIVQRGTHDQLMQDVQGPYHRLVQDGEAASEAEKSQDADGLNNDDETKAEPEPEAEAEAFEPQNGDNPTPGRHFDREGGEWRWDETRRRDQAVVRSALNRLRDAAARRGDPETPGSDMAPSADPLLDACRMIGAAMGIAIRETPTSASDLGSNSEARSYWPRLKAIAQASEIQLRQATLRDAWLSGDAGPLLGFRADDGAPVALLPRKRGGYDAADPSEGVRVRLRKATWASVVEPRAWVFYRSLPPEPVSKRDLLRFAGSGIVRELSWAMALGLMAAILGLALPIGAGYLIDDIIPAADVDRLALLTGLMVTMVLMASWLRWAQGMIMLRIDAKIASRVLPALWDRLLRLPASFFANHRAGDLSHRALGLDSLLSSISGASAQALLSGLFTSVNVALLFFYDARLAWAALGLISVGAAVTIVLIMRRGVWLREIQRISGMTQSVLLELLGGIVPIRAAAAEDRAFARWADVYAGQVRAMAGARRLMNLSAAFQTAFPTVSAMVLYAVTANLGSSISAGAFIAFNAAFFGFVNTVLGSVAVAMSLLESLPVLDRARLILETEPERPARDAEPIRLQGGLSLTNVSFRYAPDGPLALRNATIEAKPGEFVAIVGPSGSGKSTLVRLLLGFNAPEQGHAAYDGRPLGLLDVRDVRGQLGVVPQNARLKPGDLRFNVTGFAPDLTEADAWRALRLAGLEDDVKRMPMGIHTHVSEGAATLSAGQRQRLQIARALVRRPPILILDEASSALDNPTQKRIMDHVARLRSTRLVIAHRLSSIRRADRIYVMREGEVVQQGTFAELAAQPGLFQDMARRQKV